MSVVTVWSQPGCGPCYGLKAAFDRAGIAYVILDARSLPESILADWRARGWSTPVVEWAGGTFAGFDPAKVQSVIDRMPRVR